MKSLDGVQAVRILRTPHSERFVFRQEGRDFAALDLHYLASGTVAGTVVVFRGAGLEEDDVPAFLHFIDDTLLPEADLSDDNLFFTVVVGDVVGSFVPEPD